ncbi:alpha/beta fold hydrolase [Amycolatopsis cynarae]|uniref:alpha/beta fold hydrolase n=1 Tax=Amycolatopsis cynarae TaxID=2995223 RepID=UPI002E10072B
MESLLGTLPGAGEFLAAGPPWWFGFHAVPGLAETVLRGHEAEYIDFFLASGTHGRGVPAGIRDAFADAYSRPEALRCAFSYYRALPACARQIADAVAGRHLTVPTLVIGSHPVGAALERQLRPITDHLDGRIIDDCGHIIPLDRPEALLSLLLPFLGSQRP